MNSSRRHDRPRLGVALFMGNLVIMAILGAVVKSLTQHYPATEILLFRFAFATLALLFMLPRTGGISSLKTRRVLDHGMRSICGIMALGLYYYAIYKIPLADATTLA